MAREVIFETQKLQFVFSEVYGAYGSSIIPAPFVLTVGETYVINFNGSEYTRTAFSADSFIPGAIGIGNEAFIGGAPDPDNLDIIIGYVPSNDLVAMLTSSSLDSHDIGIDMVVEDEILYGVSSKTLKSLANGVRSKTGITGELVFPDGIIAAIPEGSPINIDLDFSSNDDMTATPDIGKMFSSVTVIRPTDLIPDNIAKDVVIAGIKGNLQGSAQEIATAEEMDALLVEDNVGNVYKYVGESTSDYINGDIYVVEVVE